VNSHVFDYRITTQLWQGIAIIVPIPTLVLNNSAKVRTVLCSSNAASCKSPLVKQELLICLFHYLQICSLGCDSFGTPSILSIAVHSSLLSCLVRSWMVTKCAAITVILPVFNASVVGLFWNGLQLLCTFNCIFPESWDLVHFGIIFRLEKKEEVRGGPNLVRQTGAAGVLCLNKSHLTRRPGHWEWLTIEAEMPQTGQHLWVKFQWSASQRHHKTVL